MEERSFDRFAVVSDIHGNRWALRAVLEELERDGIEDVVNLGDALYGPLDPSGTADILVRLSWPTVRGNEDRLILDPGADDSGTLRFVREEIGAFHLDWLRSLPPDRVVGDLFLCHGSPGDDAAYLLWSVERSGARTRRAGEVAAAVGGIDQRLILCGHDHVPRTVPLQDGRMVVDPGSVGLQAYRDDRPHAHFMETGTARARYAVVTRTAAGWSVEDRGVDYDWQAAAAAALRNDRPDWARYLQTGTARDL